MRRFGLPSAERSVWYHVLLATLVVGMLMHPLVDLLGRGEWLLTLTGVLMLVACSCAMGGARASRVVAWAALVPAVLLTAIFPERQGAPYAVGQGLAALVMVLVCWRILLRLFTTRDVTWATISGAVSVFLLLAALWLRLYTVAAWSPAMEQAFHGIPTATELIATEDIAHARAEVQSLLEYFSLVTLTTLGYGDVSPAHPVTRTLATTEAVAGQLYLVVLVARLVSMHAQAHGQDTP